MQHTPHSLNTSGLMNKTLLSRLEHRNQKANLATPGFVTPPLCFRSVTAAAEANVMDNRGVGSVLEVNEWRSSRLAH